MVARITLGRWGLANCQSQGIPAWFMGFVDVCMIFEFGIGAGRCILLKLAVVIKGEIWNMSRSWIESWAVS